VNRARPGDALWLGGGGALLASAFLHWVRRGTGSRLRGHELVDTLVALGGDVPGLSSARLTVLWYLVPAMGAASWIVFGLAGVDSRAARIVAGIAAVTTGITLVGFARLAELRDLGLGAWTAAAGAATLVGATFVVARGRAQ